MATRIATREEIEGALRELWRYLPNEHVCLEIEHKRYRIIREDNSRPFGSNFYPANVMYDMIFAMIEALRLAGVPRMKYLGEK